MDIAFSINNLDYIEYYYEKLAYETKLEMFQSGKYLELCVWTKKLQILQWYVQQAWQIAGIDAATIYAKVNPLLGDYDDQENKIFKFMADNYPVGINILVVVSVLEDEAQIRKCMAVNKYLDDEIDCALIFAIKTRKSNDLVNILMRIFPNNRPRDLINYLFKMSPYEPQIIRNYFADSGMHATHNDIAHFLNDADKATFAEIYALKPAGEIPYDVYLGQLIIQRPKAFKFLMDEWEWPPQVVKKILRSNIPTKFVVKYMGFCMTTLDMARYYTVLLLSGNFSNKDIMLAEFVEKYSSPELLMHDCYIASPQDLLNTKQQIDIQVIFVAEYWGYNIYTRKGKTTGPDNAGGIIERINACLYENRAKSARSAFGVKNDSPSAKSCLY